MFLLLRRVLAPEMPWFNVDDSFHSHPKALATEPAALGLWVVAGSWSSANLTEGFVPDYVLPRLLPDSATLAETLVTTGLWKRQRGGYKFHDWTQWNMTRKAVKARRASNARRQALFRDPDLKKAVRDRDGEMCRYCGIHVRWGSGRAPDSGTYDHIDPTGDNTLENLVVACVACNSRKGMRTPAQAGMTLREPRNASNASRNATAGFGNPCGNEPGEAADYDGELGEHPVTSEDTPPRNASSNASRNASTQASREAFQSNPIQSSVVDVVSPVAGSNARAYDELIINTIIEMIYDRTDRVVSPEWAGKIAGHILGDRSPPPAKPASYVRAVIEREPDPRTRFLSGYGDHA